MISDDPQTFELTYRLARNVPVDLYYLMDLSYTMADDKETLARLGVRIGLFSFFVLMKVDVNQLLIFLRYLGIYRIDCINKVMSQLRNVNNMLHIPPILLICFKEAESRNFEHSLNKKFTVFYF